MKVNAVRSPELVTGGSLGSVLVYFAGWINDPSYHQLALYLIPFLSIAITKAFFWTHLFGGRELKIKYVHFKLKRGRRYMLGLLNRPDSSVVLIEEARRRMEALELAYLNLIVDDLDEPAVGVSLPARRRTRSAP